MIEIDDIMLWRKYYFSLPVASLFSRLLKREVPLIPGVRQDYVWHLYHQLDVANDRNSWAYAEYLAMKFVTYIKEPRQRHRTPKKLLPAGKKQLNTYRYSIFEYSNGEIVARVYEPHMIDNLKMYFRYSHHTSLGDYLLYETRRGTDIRTNYFLSNLADSMHYDFWLLNKFIGGDINVV